MATILYSVKNPSTGGDTEFADMTAAYDALPEQMKRRIAGLKGIHAVSKLRKQTRSDFAAPAGRKGFLRTAESRPGSDLAACPYRIR